MKKSKNLLVAISLIVAVLPVLYSFNNASAPVDTYFLAAIYIILLAIFYKLDD